MFRLNRVFTTFRADAHPLDYMVDHTNESKRFDPDGQYVRQWLPVLSRLPPQYIHTPWEAPPEVRCEVPLIGWKERGCHVRNKGVAT